MPIERLLGQCHVPEYRSGRASLVIKAANVIRIARQVFIEHLKRYLPPKRNLLRQIDLRHRPAAESAEDVEVFQFFTSEVGHELFSR